MTLRCFRQCLFLFACLLLLALTAHAAPGVASTRALAPPPSAEVTDQTVLPPVFQPAPIPLGSDLLVGGALALRTRTSTAGRAGGVWVNAAELDFQHPITSKGTPRGNIVAQLIAEDPADIHNGQDIQIGEAYLLYRLPIHGDTGTTSFLKIGQFQLPFALLAVYDPHLRIVQPLYAQSLGLRTDWGVALTGRLYGFLQYDASLTSGSGPNHLDSAADRLVTLRLGRTFATRNGVVTIGGSLLSGRLPVTDLYNDASSSFPFAVELPPSGRVRANRVDDSGDRYTPKTRIAADGTYSFRSITARGEAMIGADKDKRVQGYYLEGDYKFTPRATVLAANSLFVYPVGNSHTARSDIGLSYAFGPKLSLSGVYEYLQDVPRNAAQQTRHHLNVQLLLRL